MTSNVGVCLTRHVKLMQIYIIFSCLIGTINLKNTMKRCLHTLMGRSYLYIKKVKTKQCKGHLHDHIILWAHSTSLALPLFIEVPVPSQESELSCIRMIEVLIYLCFYSFLTSFCNCSDNVLGFFFSFYSSKESQ